MSIPALQALRERFPNAEISVLARPWVAELYGREPFCDELISYDVPPGARGLRKKWEIAAAIRRRKFECAILLQNAFEAAALVKLAAIPMRVGYTRDARGWLLTHPIPVPKPGEIPRHQRFYYLELLKRAKIIEHYSLESRIHLHSAREAAEKGRQHFRKVSVHGAVVGISPGAAFGGAKRWLPERFANAAVQMARDRDAAIAIFGSAEESSVCNDVQRGIEVLGARCINFAGATRLGEFIELIAACEVYLTNDSGPMHIASALGVPTVAIFGATDDEATGPTGERSIVVREPVECSPCLLRECPIDHRCMTRVSVEKVTAAGIAMAGLQTADHCQERTTRS